MTTTTMGMIMTLLISTTVMMTSTIIMNKMIIDREKTSPFECGFDPKSSARMPFSLRFFLIAVIFLIFDVEITLILPLIKILKNSSTIMWSSSTFIIIIILIMGTYHEWNQGALNWSN
uniref:NADH-ubiquinone oxidoreductase chain 3 n=2 Tax=Proscopiini TaxID=443288 RepID=A0A0N7ARY9_9ORTH